MKVLAETQTILKLQYKPSEKWFLGSLGFIVCLFLLIASVLAQSATTNLVCQRVLSGEINCNLQSSTLSGGKVTQRIINLSRAYVKITRGRRNFSYQLIIETPVQKYYMISGLTEEYNQGVAQEINSFVGSEQEYLLLKQDYRVTILFLTLVISIFTCYSFFRMTEPMSTVTYDKSLNQLFIKRQGLLMSQVITQPLENIVLVDIQGHKFEADMVYRPVIVLKSQKKIPVNLEYTSLSDAKNVVLKINSFLGDL